MALIVQPGVPGAVSVPGVRVQTAIPQELKCREVKIVRSALADQIQNATPRFTKLGVIRVARELELLNRIDAGRGEQTAPVAGSCRRSVHQDQSGHVAATVKREAGVVLIARRSGRECSGDGSNARHRIHKLKRAASADRQIENRLLIQRSGLIGRLGVHVDDRRGNFDARCDVAQLQPQIEFRRLVGAKLNRRNHQFAETAGLRCQLVAPGDQL